MVPETRCSSRSRKSFRICSRSAALSGPIRDFGGALRLLPAERGAHFALELRAVPEDGLDGLYEVLALQHLKNNPLLAELALVQRGSRLSVMPVSDAEWTAILAMR